MMEVQFGILLFLVSLIFLSYKFLCKNHNFFKLRGIAYLKPTLFFGNFYDAFLELESHEKVVATIYEYFKTEKIFGVFNFLRPTIIIKDLNTAQQITADYHEKFADRDFYEIDDVLNKSLFNLRGKNWRTMRSLMVNYFSKENFKNWHHDQNVLNLKALMEHLWNDNKNANLMLNLELFLANMYCDIIFGSKSSKDENKVIMLEIMKQVEKDMNSLSGKIKIIFSTYFPWISRLFNIRLINSSAYEAFKNYVHNEMNCKCDADKIGLLDFIQNNNNCEKVSLNDSNLKDKDMIILHIFAFCIDGFFLTSKLFQACCYELGINESFQTELRKTFIHCKTFDDSKLLQNFVLETLRKWPLINNINRVCNQNCTIDTKNGEKLKFYSGDFIKIPIVLLNNDYKYFTDPQAFDIDRFHTRNEPILSFGLGTRSCFCADFALLQIKSVLFEIIQHFKILVTADRYDYVSSFNDLKIEIALKELSKDL